MSPGCASDERHASSGTPCGTHDRSKLRIVTGHMAQWLAAIRTPMRSVCRVAIAEHGNLGDVIACLPMAGLLKASFPGVQVHFVARQYTKPLVDACSNIDGFVDSDAILADPALLTNFGFDTFLNPFPWRELGKAAWKAGIPRRIAHLGRGSNSLWCNRFVLGGPPAAGLHTAQRNLRDLRGLGLNEALAFSALPALMPMKPIRLLRRELADKLCSHRFNLVVHPKSNGNGREWPIEGYLALAQTIPAERFNLLLTGRRSERQWIAERCPELLAHPNLVDLTDQLDLADFIAIVAAADGLIGAGTGPVHLAAALGINALGLFPLHKGIDSVRWSPLGAKAEWLTAPVGCDASKCKPAFGGGPCACMKLINPEQVLERLMLWRKAEPCRYTTAHAA